MKQWYKEWGVWIVSVVLLISLGVLLGHDFTASAGVYSAITAVGTLMIGAAALWAIPVWREQEREKFKASVASELHARVASIMHNIGSDLAWCGHMAALLEKDECDIDILPLLDEQKELAEVRIKAVCDEMTSKIIPRSALLGITFSDRSRDVLRKLYGLAGETKWSSVPAWRFNEPLTILGNLRESLANKALFKD